MAARVKLGEEAWAVAVAAGRALSLAQVIDEALDETLSEAASPGHTLHPRQTPD
jgi:hypothetical protein